MAALGKLFSYGPDNIDVLLTNSRSVIQKMAPEINDAIFNSIPLFKWLNNKARVIKDGGASILTPVMFGKNTTWSSYNGLDLIDTGVQQGITTAQYQWAGYAGTIALQGDELRANAGAARS